MRVRYTCGVKINTRSSFLYVKTIIILKGVGRIDITEILENCTE